MKVLFSIIAFYPNPLQFNKLLAVLKPYKVLIIDNTKNNLGYTGAANKAIKHSLKNNFDWLVILNQDIEVNKKAVSQFVKTLDKTKPGIAGPFVGTLDSKRWTTILKENSKFEALNSKQILNSKLQNKKSFNNLNFDYWNLFRISDLEFRIYPYISGSFLAIHKDVIAKVGGFYQPYFMYYEDADYCVRAQKAGFSITSVEIPGIFHQDAAPSLLHEYYLARNHLLFVKRNAPLTVKLHEILRFPKTIYQHLKNKNQGALKGIIDYYLGRLGQYK